MDQAAIITAAKEHKQAVEQVREQNKVVPRYEQVYCYENPFALALQRATEELLKKSKVQQSS